MSILLVGAGKWGQVYLSTFEKYFPFERLDIANRHNWQSKIDQKPEGVIVCTPPDSHVEIALHALQQDIPVMIEKPLALSLVDCERLRGFNTKILVNHIHLFSQGYQHLKRILGSEEIDMIQTFGWGINMYRSYSQLWDYGPHDLSMIFDLMQEDPTRIQCWKDNQYHVTMDFENKNQTRSVSTIGKDVGSNRMRKIVVHFSGLHLEYDDTIRPGHHTPPLTNAIQTFIDGVGGKDDPRFGIDLSLKIVQTLERCDYVLSQPGTIIA